MSKINDELHDLKLCLPYKYLSAMPNQVISHNQYKHEQNIKKTKLKQLSHVSAIKPLTQQITHYVTKHAPESVNKMVAIQIIVCFLRS